MTEQSAPAEESTVTMYAVVSSTTERESGRYVSRPVALAIAHHRNDAETAAGGPRVWEVREV